MPDVIIIPFTGIEEAYTEDLAYRLGNDFPFDVGISTKTIDPAFACESARNQYLSTNILEHLRELKLDKDLGGIYMGLAAVDLFIPILTYVFGESFLNGNAAVVSTYRLNPELYGHPLNRALLMDRLEKTAIHELGHSFGLKHCPDYKCVMRSSNVVEGVDLKGKAFCPNCRKGLEF